MKIAISGATGFVGSRLVERLHTEGHRILVLTRNPTFAQKVFPSPAFPNLEIIAYTPTVSGTWQDAIAGCNGVVNLAGEPIAEGRWTPERKQEILNTRKLGTQKIVEAIAKANPRPSILVNTSAIGYYGTSETASFNEDSASGNDFLSQVCQEWEQEATKVKDTNVRLVILRFGIVLGNGGALGKMITPFKLFAGGPIGSGQQWFSWIHLDDIVGLIIQSLTKSTMEGVYNATAPQPVRMNDLSTTMGNVMNRPSWLPVPGFAIEAILGDGAKVVLEGQKVLPKRTLESGFEYQYPNLQSALTQILT
ncbi:TIGR01777 family protein [Dolichospermum sp. LEGE 00240]|uniref:thylakoid membrane protein ThyD n=1 Tax=Dolichospermum sp. LEGE 00240 TaxID=1828603 RepID=UPI001882BB12|nr:TIGR01777 family oxidoreductase [Dolichospermum sp. LEGE 00240]MDM3843990.1 TIGR01777 family oxidoreductase [Aphanizomenon gracile PMC638.10]MDM3853185.1 TIGR01777 family oxidoreductase [Aphanizomenon gracile PMC627.10]MDM3853727.1 TIGR01777 family oxidoreductase [Aphanizomenon gracile PMC649.10]MDM3862860.1 TIGR01777 family oxidoreductase [Aphanizomenon gracile PMC644.10]MBE9250570.1 TIGR01777 family protein [Dolichospermum sp. LEGE 00240]